MREKLKNFITETMEKLFHELNYYNVTKCFKKFTTFEKSSHYFLKNHTYISSNQLSALKTGRVENPDVSALIFKSFSHEK